MKDQDRWLKKKGKKFPKRMEAKGPSPALAALLARPCRQSTSQGQPGGKKPPWPRPGEVTRAPRAADPIEKKVFGSVWLEIPSGQVKPSRLETFNISTLLLLPSRPTDLRQHYIERREFKNEIEPDTSPQHPLMTAVNEVRAPR